MEKFVSKILLYSSQAGASEGQEQHEGGLSLKAGNRNPYRDQIITMHNGTKVGISWTEVIL